MQPCGHCGIFMANCSHTNTQCECPAQHDAQSCQGRALHGLSSALSTTRGHYAWLPLLGVLASALAFPWQQSPFIHSLQGWGTQLPVWVFPEWSCCAERGGAAAS